MKNLTPAAAGERKPGRTFINLAVDATLSIAFLVAMSPHIGSIALHEWVSLGLGAGAVIHLLLHWPWLAATVARWFRPMPWQQRVNGVLNTALFVAFCAMLLSGMMISRVAAPALGLTLPAGASWRGIHSLSANISLALVAGHIAMHWDWIVSTLKRLLPARRAGGTRVMPAGK